MRHFVHSALAALMLTASMGANAAAAQTCELHVWAQDLKAQPNLAPKSSFLVKFTPFTDDPLSVSWLMEPFGRISEVDDAALLRAVQMPADSLVVRHGEGDMRAAKKAKARLIPGTTDCYADLVFEIPAYWPSRTQSNGKDRLDGGFVFRKFGPDPKPLLEIKSGTGAILTKSYQDKSLTEPEARAVARQASADMVAYFALAFERKTATKK